VQRVDRAADDVVPVDPGCVHGRLQVPHRRLRLLSEVVAADEREVRRERDLAGEVGDARPVGDRDVAEARRRVQVGRVDELTMVRHVWLLSRSA
jgi:hypothetical protein